MKHILVINTGSSSLKFKLFICGQKKYTVAKGSISEIGSSNQQFSCKVLDPHGKTLTDISDNINDELSREDAFGFIIEYLCHPEKEPAALKSLEAIEVIGHRVVHGGTLFNTPVLLTPSNLHHLDALTSLAPLHNGPALAIIRHSLHILPKTPNWAVFDTMFHSTIPEHIYTYPLPLEMAREKGVRKYGFHGISHKYVTGKVRNYMGGDYKVISLHLGSGSSVCAVGSDGNSVDTTMGLTPLSGLPGATRSGDIDPSTAFHLLPTDPGKLTPSHLTRAEYFLNHSAGFAALCGTTSFREIVPPQSQPASKLAFDLFANRIQNFIGAYFVLLEGCDAILFTGGIGENSKEIRTAVAGKLTCLGAMIDEAKNEYASDKLKHGEDLVEISRTDSKIRVFVVSTDEEREIAEAIIEYL